MGSEIQQDLNPGDMPVEKLVISVSDGGVMKEINALDSYWVEARQLTIYEKPPLNNMVSGSLDIWKTKMSAYLVDVKWLLELEHHRFWSTILFHSKCMDMLVSFLQEALPPYMQPYQDKKIRQLYEDIRRTVLIVFCRIVTNKESKSNWMTKEHMRDVLYEKFLLTIPILWDICLIYGSDNSQHVARIVRSVFTLQPKYLADLEVAISFVKEAFKFIILQVNKEYDNTEPPNLPETFKGFGDIQRNAPNISKDESLALRILKDLIVHLLDTAMTLRICTEMFPKCVDVLRKRGFVLSIVQLYEYAMPHMYEKLDELSNSPAEHDEIQSYIDMARAELIDLFREVLAKPKNAIFNGEGSVESNVEEYIAIMMDGLSEKLFIKDYHSCYPVHEDLEMLKQAYPNIDTVKTDFILQAIYSNLDDEIPETVQINENLINGYANIDNIDTHTPDTIENVIPQNIKEESLISEVKDIFPDLGDGFVLKCLQHYSFNSERVINSILEDNLHPSLLDLDRTLPLIPEDPVDTKFLETGIDRLNVFDGDEFDIMTRDDIDLSRIHLGKKKGKHKDLKDLLNDKTEVRGLSDIYSKYNLVCDESSMYSDEYDDTYDGEPDVNTDVAIDDVRPVVTPRVLAQGRAEEQSYEDSSEEEQQPSASSSKSRMDFCVNPEEMRARREANMRMRNNKGMRPPPRNADVIGKPKGQGQEKEVLVSREKKEKHKSSRANHNRRSGAQWKRSQGMMPS